MHETAVRLFQIVQDTHAEAYERVSAIKQRVVACTDTEELADYAYVLRECEKYAKDLASEMRRLKETAEKLACLIWTQEGEGEPIRTPYCTASPTIKTAAAIPKPNKDPERYEALMKYLGVPEKLWGTDMIRVHWPGFVEHTTELEEQGKQLPPGVDPDKTYTLYSLRITKKLGVLE